MRKGLFLLIVFALIGLWVSYQLVEVHVQASFGAGDTGICAANDAFSCSEVALSSYSKLLGIPIAVLGEAFMAVVVLLGLGMLRREEAPEGLWDALLLSTLLALVYSIFLGVVSSTQIGKLCPYCMGLYAINAALFATVWFSHPQGARQVVGRVPQLVRAKGFWLMTGLMVGAVAISQGMYLDRAATEAAAAAERKAKLEREMASQPAELASFDLDPAQGRGPADAPVVIVEFSDFECPHCQRFAKSLKEVQQKRPDLLRYHFKQWPMDNACNASITRPFHEFACAAAVAAHCAYEQGKFWPMHDRLFDNRTELAADELVEHAEAVGLDVSAFEACVANPQSLEAVKKDIAEGRKLGVRGTPNFFLNGKKFRGGKPARELLELVDAAAAAAEAGSGGGAAVRD